MSKFNCVLFNDSIIKSIQQYNICFEDHALAKKVIADFLLANNVKQAFGDFGEKFKRFILSIDMSHPELFSFTHGLFGDQGLIEIKEILELQKYCSRKKHKHVLNNLYRLCDSFSSQKATGLGKNWDSLEQAKVHTRFLRREQRWAVRSQKKGSIIHLSKKNQVIEDAPRAQDVFVCYHHNSQKIQNVLNGLMSKHENFIKINCMLMAAEINAAIEKLKTDLNLQSFGFHRITLNVVARNLNTFCEVAGNVCIHPVTQEMAQKNESLNKIIDLCESYPAFCGDYAVFDHYAYIKDDLSDIGIIVGERDAQSFFIGYYYD